ncbi:WD40/YVTN/BNR-like repeat-containing protein [Phenylobacterium montanum]|uniref:Exo-alpha-sialidase n=1 Tax=Phenylobacterium montanum TaxID=2823693 RepID=A0A975IWQ7_9CAUL|nr:glycoside hydrolase [Caulobacter sp. S6]QUD90332.1 exo-alpha-sialidase [Caulobacter sp. S6]
MFKPIAGARLAMFAAALVLAGSAKADPAIQAYSWRTVPFGGGGFVDGFVYHPKAKNVLYARTDVGGAYRYDFSARRWIPLLDGLSHSDGDLEGALSMAVDPNAPNKLYLACGLYLGDWARNAAVLRSDDQGATWSKTELPFKLGGNADGRGAGERLQVDPNAGQTLFLGSNQNGLWKSADGGQSFAKVSGYPSADVTLVLIDPASGAANAPSRTLYVGAGDSSGHLYVSHDGGASFGLVPGAPAQTPQHAVIGPDGFLYVAFSAGDGKGKGDINPSGIAVGGVWKMDLKSGAWTEISPIRPVLGSRQFGYSGIDVDPAHPGTVVVSTIDRWWPEPDDIFLSRDGGAHWMGLSSQSHHDLTRFPWLSKDGAVNDPGRHKMGSWTSDVKINPFNPDEMIYGTGGGLWMTRNLSAAGSGKPVEFDFADDNLEETATIAMVSPPAGSTLLAAFGDVAGAAWDDVTKSPPIATVFKPNESNRSVDVAWLNPAVVARTTDGKPYGYYSEDGALTWKPFPSAPPYAPQDAKGEWRTMGPVAVSAGGTAFVVTVPHDKAYFSADKGKTWTPSAGWPDDLDGRLVPVADKAADKVFYAHDRAGGRVMASSDGGASFKPIVTGLPAVAYWDTAELATTPGRLRDLWLAAPFGLLHSAGASKPMANLQGVDSAVSVAFGKAAPGQAYPAVFIVGKVKGQDGLWRSDDEGKTWVRINDDAHQFASAGPLAGDPLEYGTVYVGVGGRGVMMGVKTQ